MTRQKVDRDTPKLPLRIKNLLRGSRSPATTVSQLRGMMNVGQFPALLAALPLFPHRGRSLMPAIAIPVGQFRTDVPLLEEISIGRELAWAAAVFLKHSTVLNRFINLKCQFESALLVGQFESCEELLNQMEKEFGFSLWLLEMRIAFLQMARGLEAQKTYSSSIRDLRREGDLISFLAHFVSWRNEDTTNPFQFKKTLSDKAADWDVRPDFRDHLLFRLTGACSLDSSGLSNILRHEASYSLVDYYETFVKQATLHLSRETMVPRDAFATSVSSLIDVLVDARLLKLLSMTAGTDFEYLDRCQLRSVSSDDALLGRDYARLQNLECEINENPDDVRIWFNGAIVELDAGHLVFQSTGLGARFTRLLRAVMEKKAALAEGVMEGARLASNFSYLPSIFQFESFFWPQLSSTPTPDANTHLAAFLSSRFLDPAVLRFLPIARRTAYAKLLDSKYGDTRVITFEKWRAGEDSTGELQRQLKDSIDPLLFREVLIEHSAAADRYDDAVNLAHELEADAGLRYRRVAERWIAECLFKLDRIEDAIDYVCHACISDRDLAPMMPLARCASALDKKRRAALAGKLSTSIVLDIYARQFESTIESERNYAYEDFLTSQKLQRPSQLKDLASKYEHPLLIYYLQFVCVPEVMQVSTAFSSSRELDEERLAVCAILAQIDPDNLEEHEKEIREITRKLVVRRGVREVEQSKIFVDMPAIRRWAEKNLKEGFLRYQALSNAGLDAGGEGIASALRDMLAGVPVSKEYLHLPKNETSDLLVNMVSDFLDQCLTNPAHGLDSYLSMRIRHGALAGQLRAPLEQEKIISQREGPLDEYKPNQYWLNQLQYWPDHIIEALDKRMREFSKTFDIFVDRIANDYIQIRSNDKPQGLFHLPLNALMVRAFASDISKTTTVDDFITMCADLFWQMLDPSLQEVHRTIEEKVKPEMTQLFARLREDLKKLEDPYDAPQLETAILNAQTKAQQALEQVKDWFRVVEPLVERTFTFDEIVEIGLECVRNQHPDFHPRLTTNAPLEGLRVASLSFFSDIFFIVFDNVRKHAGMLEPEVTVSANLKDGRLDIRIVNELAANAITPERERQVDEIRATIAQGEGEYLRAVRSEGGTGLKKLRNILRRVAQQPEFGFIDRTFFVRFDVPIIEVVKAPDEKAVNA